MWSVYRSEFVKVVLFLQSHITFMVRVKLFFTYNAICDRSQPHFLNLNPHYSLACVLCPAESNFFNFNGKKCFLISLFYSHMLFLLHKMPFQIFHIFSDMLIPITLKNFPQLLLLCDTPLSSPGGSSPLWFTKSDWPEGYILFTGLVI